MHVPGRPSTKDKEGKEVEPATPGHWRFVGGVVIGLGAAPERREFDHTIVELDEERMDRFIILGRDKERYTSARDAMWDAFKNVFKGVEDK
jgi:hypothetical protein